MSEIKVKTETPLVMDAHPGIWEKEAIKADQNGIKTDLGNLDKRIHMNAYQCLRHAETHGDVSLMVRLFVDIIPDKATGYRRQNLLGWVRMYSPIELKGKDNMALTGTNPDGTRKAFRCDEAFKNPFWTLRALDEVGERPIFRDTLTSKIKRAISEYKAGLDNAVIVDGKVVGPKNPKLPFYDGTRLEEIDRGFDKIELVLNEMLAFDDKSKDIRTAKVALKRAETAMAEATKG